MSDKLTDQWDNLKDNLPASHAEAAEQLFNLGDKIADALDYSQSRIAELEAELADARAVTDGWPPAELAGFARHMRAELSDAKAELARVTAAGEALYDHLVWSLPMARGYAYQNKHKVNFDIVEGCSCALTAWRDRND